MNRIKKGDNVLVISGKDKFKEGVVLSVDPRAGTAIVEGLNIITKAVKKDATHEQGGLIKMPAPIRLCKLMLLDQKGKTKGVATRVRYEIDKSGNKVRVAKKSGNVIANASK